MTCPVHDPVVHVDADENYVKTTCRVCGASLDDLLADVELTPVEVEDALYGQKAQAD